MRSNKSDKWLKRQQEYLGKVLVQAIIETHYVSGNITDSDLADKGVLLEKVRRIIAAKNLNFVIDHRPTILEQADLFCKAGKYEFAKVFYATFFEHCINAVIDAACVKKRIDEKTRMSVIRSVNLSGKLSWLLSVLGLKPFNKVHLTTITQLTEQRNSIVHYKWNRTSFDEDDGEMKQEIQFYKKIKAAIAYTKRYESIVLFNKSSSKVKKALRGSNSHTP